MRVEVHSADLGGCGHYRMIWPAQAVADQQLCDVSLYHNENVSTIPAVLQDREDGPHVVGLGDYDWPEVLVLQRPLQRLIVEAIPFIQAKGVSVVVEIDDDFSTIDPHNVGWAAAHPALSPMRNFRCLADACRAADMVTVTTPALAKRYGSHGRVRILPNLVPRAYLDIKVPEFRNVIGWSGSVETHPGDLEVTRGAVARVLKKTGATFGVVGTGAGVQARLALASAPVAAGWVDLGAYPSAMSEIDVMSVPLKMSAFNEAKSWLKGLEAASVGAAVVASPTKPYQMLAAMGLCRLASSPRDWERELRAALDDVSERSRVAERSRDIIVSKRLTVEDRASEWVEAWTAAMNRRSGNARRG